MRNQDNGAAGADKTAHIGHELRGNACIKRRGRLIENNQFWRSAGRGKVDGDFDHLPLGDGKLVDGGTAVDLVARKNLVELFGNQFDGLAAPASARQVALHDADIFGNGQVWKQRQFLKDAAHAMLARHRYAVSCFLMIGNAAFMWRQPAIDDIDDGGFARAIVADQPDAFTFADHELSAIQCFHRTELHANIARGDDLPFLCCFCHTLN